MQPGPNRAVGRGALGHAVLYSGCETVRYPRSGLAHEIGGVAGRA